MSTEQKALDHLRRLIKIGHYVEHGRLPSERALAKELNVARSELRKALATLEAEGKITRFVGRGTFVGSGPLEDNALSSGVFASASPGEVMEARLVIEPRLAAMAAVNANQQDIDYLLLCVEKSNQLVNWDSWQRWDSTFHRTIALCSRNNLLADIIEKFNKIRSLSDWKKIRGDALSPAGHKTLVAQHRAIANFIAGRDPAGAASAMRNHLTDVEQNLFGDHDITYPLK